MYTRISAQVAKKSFDVLQQLTYYIKPTCVRMAYSNLLGKSLLQAFNRLVASQFCRLVMQRLVASCNKSDYNRQDATSCCKKPVKSTTCNVCDVFGYVAVLYPIYTVPGSY